MLTEAKRDSTIDEAVAAAADVVDVASDDPDERDEMWRRLCGGVLISALAEADAEAQASMAKRLNRGLEALGVPWRLVLEAP